MNARILLAIMLFGCTFQANIVSQQAQLVSALIDGCTTGGLTDGQSEYLVLFSGNSSFTAGTSTIDITYGNSPAPTQGMTDSFVAGGNASLVSDLNSNLTGSCTDLTFINVDPGTTSIPANSHIIIFNDGIGSNTTLDFSAWCGQGNVYVLFSDDNNWIASGRFTNAPSGNRYFRSVINGTTTDFDYSDQWSSTADGNYVQWNDGGGSGAIYSNYTGCQPSDLNGLPVTLISFTGTLVNGRVRLKWQTADEQNNSHFSILRSENGETWEPIEDVAGHTNSETLQNYEFIDQRPPKGWLYYRLKQNDLNGDYQYSEMISILNTQDIPVRVYPNPAADFLIVQSSEPIAEITLVNTQGISITLWGTSQLENRFDLSNVKNGLYKVLVRSETSQTIMTVVVTR